jgi:serine/threonine protein kinase
VVIGTPQYMSPEQAMGKRGDELDGRADLYSLGVVMYQMLTADMPFKAETTMEMLLAHMQKPPAPIGVLHPELQVPENVASLAMRLLEKNRDLRPASGRALIQEIEKIERDLSSPGRTRVLTADDLIRAESRGPTGGDRGAAPVAVPPRPQPTPVRPVEPPRPVPPPVVRPQPQVVALPLRSKAPESRWGIWAAVIVLLVGIGGGALYIATRQPSGQSEPPPIPSPASNPTSTPTPTQTPTQTPTPTPTATPTPTQAPPTEPVSNPTPPPSPETTPEPPRQDHKTRNAHKTEPSAPPEPVAPAVDPKEVKQKLAWGKFHLGRGEYDEAIASFQEGLKLDPSNAVLRQELDGAIKACKSETATLGESFKCGGH